ncbi:hypothetical protein MP638_004081 [Amoeboaphelidium occidentale]|nr:hypothetical protein MP638_004081 [Amoeboaphelidium occidentale]
MSKMQEQEYTRESSQRQEMLGGSGWEEEGQSSAYQPAGQQTTGLEGTAYPSAAATTSTASPSVGMAGTTGENLPPYQPGLQGRAQAGVSAQERIVTERIIPVQEIQTQPIVERRHIVPEIIPVLQKRVERAQMPAKVFKGQALPPVQRQFTARQQPVNLESVVPQRQRQTMPASVKHTMLPAVVHETYERRPMQEIIPVVEQEIVQPTIIQREEPIIETIYESPRLVYEGAQWGRGPAVAVSQRPGVSSQQQPSGEYMSRGERLSYGQQQENLPGQNWRSGYRSSLEQGPRYQSSGGGFEQLGYSTPSGLHQQQQQQQPLMYASRSGAGRGGEYGWSSGQSGWGGQQQEGYSPTWMKSEGGTGSSRRMRAPLGWK